MPLDRRQFLALMAAALGTGTTGVVDLLLRDGSGHHRAAAAVAFFDPRRDRSADGHKERHAIGCGAVKLHRDAPAEIKRMWIAPQARGLGLGRRLLEKLEACALAGGARVAHIETSAVLTEALALYRSAGWIEVPPFNDEPFADHWLEKSLT